MSEIPISTLPLELDSSAAIEAAYRDDLDWIQSKLSRGISVLVECDKQLTIHLFQALRARFRADTESMRLRLVTGHMTGEASGNNAMQTIMQRTLTQLQEAVFSGAEDEVIVLPHLDILTTTTRSGLSAETREASALLYENPDALYLAFKDPSFELPKVIENVFAIKVPLIGLARDRLPALIRQAEARKFCCENFNPYLLYKYVSGLNAIRLREILAQFSSWLDYTPSNPTAREDLLREIRQMTLTSDVELPRVDLEADIGGYEKVKKRIRE